MAAVVTMTDLLKAGVHFGHQTRRWNPKMGRYLWGERNGIYIIDLQQTITLIDQAYTYVRDTVSKGGTILFVGTKKQAQDPIETFARACGMPFVNQRWLGGMLTNFRTIRGRVEKMLEYERMLEAGDFESMPKKEALLLRRELDKLQLNLNGLRHMEKLPSAIFVLDTPKEHIAVAEANRLKLPVVAVADSNSDPDQIDFVIPGNDDAIRSTELLSRVISDAVREGRYIAQSKGIVVPVSGERTPEQEARVANQQAESEQEAMAQAAAREARIAAEQAAKATEVVAAQSAATQAVDEAVSVSPDSDEQPAS
ncbi:MAG TPA: 30S ribosomal protein S2 [Acidimicrobiaceae bacterium]|jgi:small subunit ribosomal protein S2|nr:30S ribosomal protein S2 [Actinomycetota bacterium]HAN08921.1 30S ribosomal protein S2 [Acidimicrobiaceae bacterium]